MNGSWKTSICGGLAMILTGAAMFVPSPYQAIVLGAATVFNGLGHFFARDNSVADYQVGAGNTGGK